jgi:hypothetical protein
MNISGIYKYQVYTASFQHFLILVDFHDGKTNSMEPSPSWEVNSRYSKISQHFTEPKGSL